MREAFRSLKVPFGDGYGREGGRRHRVRRPVLVFAGQGARFLAHYLDLLQPSEPHERQGEAGQRLILQHAIATAAGQGQGFSMAFDSLLDMQTPTLGNPEHKIGIGLQAVILEALPDL